MRIFAAASGDKIFCGIESLLQTPYNKIHICRIMELRHERHLLKIRDQDPQAFLEGIVALNDKAVFKDVGLGVLSSFIPKNKLNKSI